MRICVPLFKYIFVKFMIFLKIKFLVYSGIVDTCRVKSSKGNWGSWSFVKEQGIMFELGNNVSSLLDVLSINNGNSVKGRLQRGTEKV